MLVLHNISNNLDCNNLLKVPVDSSQIREDQREIFFNSNQIFVNLSNISVSSVSLWN